MFARDDSERGFRIVLGMAHIFDCFSWNNLRNFIFTWNNLQADFYYLEVVGHLLCSVKWFDVFILSTTFLFVWTLLSMASWKNHLWHQNSKQVRLLGTKFAMQVISSNLLLLLLSCYLINHVYDIESGDTERQFVLLLLLFLFFKLAGSLCFCNMLWFCPADVNHCILIHIVKLFPLNIF